MRRVGVLWGIAPETPLFLSYRMEFTRVLQDLGWSEERNIRIDHRWSVLDPGRLLVYATELIALAPDVLVGDSSPSTAALLRQTNSIPIVFARVVDPLGQGFIDNFARPSRNATGFSNQEDTLAGKWVELLKETVPSITRIALVYNPVTAPFTQSFLPSFEAAALANGVKPIAVAVHDIVELETFLEGQGRDPGGSIVAQTDSFVTLHRDLFITAVARYRLPAMWPARSFVEAGGLISYGNRTIEMYRGAATYVNRILRGAKVADLPVQAPTTYELVINLRTAKALGLDVPWFLQQRADDMIE